MHISERGLRLIEAFEGYVDHKYYDSVGVATIGYGTTASVISPLPETCTRAEAEGWLRLYVERDCEPAINRLGVPLNQNQFDALCSLVYNCGPGVMGWQIGRDLRARAYGAAANDFMLYVYAGGQRLQGLVNRRAAEKALFETRVAPPPPPDPYRHFDRTVRNLGHGHRASEYDTVKEYDRKRRHPRRYPLRLHTLRSNCHVLADRLTEVIIQHDRADNDKNHRYYRREQLQDRAHGEVTRP